MIPITFTNQGGSNGPGQCPGHSLPVPGASVGPHHTALHHGQRLPDETPGIQDPAEHRRNRNGRPTDEGPSAGHHSGHPQGQSIGPLWLLNLLFSDLLKILSCCCNYYCCCCCCLCQYNYYFCCYHHDHHHQGYEDSMSAIRKDSVFTLVRIYLLVGDELKPYLKDMSNSKVGTHFYMLLLLLFCCCCCRCYSSCLQLFSCLEG